MYEQLKSDILEILRCKDNFMSTKVYNADGNITTKPEEIAWVYVPNREMIFTMPTEKNQKLIVGKNDINFDKTLSRALQQMRKVCNLNGVPLVVRKYSEIDKRKVFNIVKQNVFEAAASKIATEMQSLQTYKVGCSYIPLEAQVSRTKCLVENACDTLKMLAGKKSKHLHRIIKGLFESVNKNYVDQMNCLPTPNKILLQNSVKLIETVFLFVKNQNSVYATKKTKYPITAITEWAKVMEIDELPMMNNLEAATQKLFMLSEGCKSQVDLLRVIRDNKICEDYMVSRQDLVESWLQKKPALPHKSYLIETTDGTEVLVPAKCGYARKKICKMIDEAKGKFDLTDLDIILEENERLDNLVDFLKRYRGNPDARKLMPVAIRLTESAIRFFDDASMEIAPHLTVSENSLFEVASVKNHPAYSEIMAEYLTEAASKKAAMLNEHKREQRILVNEFEKYVGKTHAEMLAESVLGKHISLMSECADTSCKDFIKSLKQNAYTLDPVVRKCFDKYLACKSYQSEEKLRKLPAIDILKAYIK